jgi:competence protein ComEC
MLSVYFLNVGQGDGIYIRTPGGQDIVIDGGPDARIVAALGKVMPFWDTEIDVLLLTHPHADHVAGLVDILKRYKVDAVYYTGVNYSSGVYSEFLNLIKEKNIPLRAVIAGDHIPLFGAGEFDVLWPKESLDGRKVDDLNNSSIVAKLVFGDIDFLFAGDAEEKVEKELLAGGKSLDVDLLKLGHHGSKTASSQEFLKAITPEYAVISCGKNNDFGFPHLLVLRRLARLGVEIFRTDLNGTVVARTDGKTLKLEKAR